MLITFQPSFLSSLVQSLATPDTPTPFQTATVQFSRVTLLVSTSEGVATGDMPLETRETIVFQLSVLQMLYCTPPMSSNVEGIVSW